MNDYIIIYTRTGLLGFRGANVRASSQLKAIETFRDYHPWGAPVAISDWIAKPPHGGAIGFGYEFSTITLYPEVSITSGWSGELPETANSLI
jgi:hypothetical protein